MSPSRSELERTPAASPLLVLEVAGSPGAVAVAAGIADVRVRTVDPASVASLLESLPAGPGALAADVRAIRSLLHDGRGRAWLAQGTSLSVILPIEEPASLLADVVLDLETLGLRVRGVRLTGSLVVVDLKPGGADLTDLTALAISAMARSVRDGGADRADAELARWERARLQVRLRAALERELEGLEREDALLTEARELRAKLRFSEGRLTKARRTATGGDPVGAARQGAAMVRRRVRRIVKKG